MEFLSKPNDNENAQRLKSPCKDGKMKLQNKFLKAFLCSQNVSFSFSWVCKIPILNVAVAIEAMVSVKKFLRNFPITFSKRSVFTFIVIKPITKFGFRFPNVGNFTTNFTFQ